MGYFLSLFWQWVFDTTLLVLPFWSWELFFQFEGPLFSSLSLFRLGRTSLSFEITPIPTSPHASVTSKRSCSDMAFCTSSSVSGWFRDCIRPLYPTFSSFPRCYLRRVVFVCTVLLVCFYIHPFAFPSCSNSCESRWLTISFSATLSCPSRIPIL